MNETSTALVRQLLQARQERRSALVPEPVALAQAYEIQRAHTAEILSRFGGNVIGLKLGATNAKAFAALGIASPFLGPIFSAFTWPSPARIERADFLVCIIEAEIGMSFRRDFGGDGVLPARDALIDAADSVFPAIEVADSRYQDWATAPVSAIVSDLGYAGGWVRGEPCPRWRELDLSAVAVRLEADGVEVRTGSGAAVLGDPWHALSLAIADLGRQGRELNAGEVVSTGTCTVPLVVSGPVALMADFGPLGRVQLDIA